MEITMKLNREALAEMQKNLKIYNSISFIDTMLKHYGLLPQESNILEEKLLNFSHLDIELEKGEYRDRVNLWLDFVTTLCVAFEVEPLVLTENGGIPNLRHVLKVIQGNNIDTCPECKGTGTILSTVDYDFHQCSHCHGLGFMLPEVDIRFDN